MGGSPIAGYYNKKKEGDMNRAADAAGRAAQDREFEAREQKRLGMSRLNTYGNQEIKAASGSVAELNALSKQYESADKMLQRDETLLANIDPAIMEASKQALALLRGEKASSQAPMDAQRGSQRSALVQRLREQFGPGAEASSIGQKALQQFDMESSTLASQNQQNTLGTLLGTSMQARGMAGAGMQSSTNQLGQIAGAYGGINARKATAIGNVANRYGNFGAQYNANVLNAAGSREVSNILSSQAAAGYHGAKAASAQADHETMMGFMTSMYSMGQSGPASKAQPTETPGGGGNSAGGSYQNYGGYA